MISPSSVYTPISPIGASIREHTGSAVNNLLASLPDPGQLSAGQRRGIIARYTAVLEGNFIYWMIGAFLAVRSEQARTIILDNLQEEVRDSHPAMLRRFAIAAKAVPGDLDVMTINRALTNVRLFVGLLSGVRIVLMMTFFEEFIQRFMGFLAELAKQQGSAEMEYTDIHGVCDIAHTEGLFRALAAEIALDPPDPGTDLFEGVALLETLIQTIVDPTALPGRFTEPETLNQNQNLWIQESDR
jgi:hypothetical protein